MSKAVLKPQDYTRTVYEIDTPGQGVQRVEASNTAALKEHLTRLLPGVEPYALQAVARLASIEQASVQSGKWGIRRIGVMQFQPDPVPQEIGPRPGKRQLKSPVPAPIRPVDTLDLGNAPDMAPQVNSSLSTEERLLSLD